MKKYHYTLLYFVLFFTSNNLFAQTPPIGSDIAVTATESGAVRGYLDKDVFTYKGIPYGTAERFMPASKPKPWSGTRSSMTYGPVAPLQNPPSSVNDEMEFLFQHDWGYTSEDCLRLNIWTKGLKDGKKRPVMFWIHGGGYVTGSSQELPSYDGKNLSQQGDVVVVSINHRLNILGFLDLSAYGSKYAESANLSILDIVLALKWVKTNIHNFGGDPNNVTIFGQSGGGAKVNTLMAMPKAQGLFHKAISQSGAIRTAILEKETTQNVAARLLKELNLEAHQVDSLQHIPYPTLVAAGRKALKQEEQIMKAAGKPLLPFGLNWGPSRDGTILPFQVFSKEAFELSKAIPLMLGSLKNEFIKTPRAGLYSATDIQAEAFLKERYGVKTTDYIQAAKLAYPDDYKPSDLIDIDLLYRPGTILQANGKSAIQNSAPVYLYLFTWQSPVFAGKYKAMHCMELAFMFNNIQRCRQMTGGGSDAQILADKMSQAWINFAETGNPNHADLPAWPRYDGHTRLTMFFDNTCFVKRQHDLELMEFLRRLKN